MADPVPDSAVRTRRLLILVLDGLGIGALPDAARYGDEGSDTLGNTARAVGGLRVPVLERLGLGTLADLPGIRPVARPEAAAGIMRAQAAGKDSTTGHWELAGLILRRPFPTYPDGFPPEIIEALAAAIGRRVLGNVPASGTEIIRRLGEEHVRTGAPIVYTSADSVLQIAAHEDVVPVEQLYAWCRTAREILQGEHGVSRVIARPFAGPAGAFVRTPRRRDFSLPPVGPTVLDAIAGAGYPVVGVGKVEDLFAGRGVTDAVHTSGDMDGLTRAVEVLRRLERGLVFCTLVDLDTVYGHRNDPQGFAQHLAAIDSRLPEVLDAAGSAGLVIITADHGNDPTTPSTDHSREHVPVLAWGAACRPGRRWGCGTPSRTSGLLRRRRWACPGAALATVSGRYWHSAAR